jgi:DhnA family fructose-bisphosphate aldolase class Ia
MDLPGSLSHSPDVNPASVTAILSPELMLKSAVNLRIISVGVHLNPSTVHERSHIEMIRAHIQECQHNFKMMHWK